MFAGSSTDSLLISRWLLVMIFFQSEFLAVWRFDPLMQLFSHILVLRTSSVCLLCGKMARSFPGRFSRYHVLWNFRLITASDGIWNTSTLAHLWATSNLWSQHPRSLFWLPNRISGLGDMFLAYLRPYTHLVLGFLSLIRENETQPVKWLRQIDDRNLDFPEVLVSFSENGLWCETKFKKNFQLSILGS